VNCVRNIERCEEVHYQRADKYIEYGGTPELGSSVAYVEANSSEHCDGGRDMKSLKPL
jgi:hypothetical protein